MSNLILKISDGELFNFFDSEARKEFIVGSKRTCDVVIKSFMVAPEQLRFLEKNNVWYVEDLTPEGYKSEVLAGGKKFRRPVVRFDGDIVIRKTGEKRGDTVKISAVKKISGKRGGSNYDLSHRTLTVVGRNSSCDIVVDSPMVSEKHFRIVCDDGDYYIEDLRSMSGTFVNNRKVRRAKLRDYDRISIPTAAYTFFERRLLYSTSPAGIQIDAVGVTKEVADRHSRGRVKLVNSVSFRIEPGAFVAIVGGSGTGKSTCSTASTASAPQRTAASTTTPTPTTTTSKPTSPSWDTSRSGTSCTTTSPWKKGFTTPPCSGCAPICPKRK